MFVTTFNILSRFAFTAGFSILVGLSFNDTKLKLLKRDTVIATECEVLV